ncbi:MAG: GDSL-type esterase/lipase family protein [Oscillospiraceae bacterium]|nr:GDSL-type esterase/lipase family protein [Oscillospiraceae bacterium]
MSLHKLLLYTIVISAVITISPVQTVRAANSPSNAVNGVSSAANSPTNAANGATSAAVGQAGAADIVTFADVKQSDWAYKDIRKLAEASIISGDKPDHPEGNRPAPPHEIQARPSFRPGDTLSREECAVIIARLADAIPDAAPSRSSRQAAALPSLPSLPSLPALPATSARTAQPTAPQTFADVPQDRWSFDYVEAAKAYITGHSETGDGAVYFHPDDPMCRGDLVSALMRLIGAQSRPSGYGVLESFADNADITREWRPYIAAAVERSVLLGDDEKRLKLVDPVTRREASALIVRALGGHMQFPDPVVPEIYAPELDSGFYDAYFNGAVFIGDSITMGLRNYVLSERSRGNGLLGEARFLCAGSYGLNQAAAPFNPDGVNLSYQGVSMSMEDCISKMEAKEVYLMLGMNDWAGATLPDSIIKYGAILDKVAAKNPETVVYIQFCTPITTEREATRLNNANTDKFNAAIVEMCAERGIDYVDVSTPMKDANNALKGEYASDNYVHMNAAGCEAWIGALRDFTMDKYVNAQWGPPSGAQAPPEAYPGEYVHLD